MDRSTQTTTNTSACYSAAFTCLTCGHESTTRKRLHNHLRALSHAIPKAKLVSKSKMTTNMSTKLKSDFELFKINPRAYFATFPKNKHSRLNIKSKNTKSKNKLKNNKSLNNKSKNSRTKDESASNIFRIPINIWQYLDEQEYREQTPIKVKTSKPQFRSQKEALLERVSQQNEQTRRIRSGSTSSINLTSSTKSTNSTSSTNSTRTASTGASSTTSTNATLASMRS
ncbi:hypothetical protein MMC14_009396, partial [Varicellaria rhodocarpa]|nr:hypothetical protein [Varicellaria rhodocarpa]